MNRPFNTLLTVAVLWAAGVGLAPAAAAGSELVALQGLVPPTGINPLRTPEGLTAAAAGLARQPGLRLPASTGQSYDEAAAWDTRRYTLYGGTRATQRSGGEYSQTFGGLRYPVSGRWASSLEASVDETSPMFARAYALSGQLHRSLPGGWGVSLGLQYNIYEPGAFRLHTPAPDAGGGVLHQALPWAPGASSGSGYELRLNLRYGERNTVGLAYGTGRETDYARQMVGAYPADVRQFGLTGQHWLTPDWAVSYGLMAQDQIGLNRGQGLRLGLRYRF
ncbi:MAG: YaiO family outer membrane beta-barrel protein [Betaproteobacteria bacterium]|nr:YaiO family outer membrane beta-barrel protein [Betaproteobacteria bacterium]